MNQSGLLPGSRWPTKINRGAAALALARSEGLGVPGVGQHDQAASGDVVESVRFICDIARHRGDHVGTTGVVTVKPSVGASAQRLMGRPYLEVDHRDVLGCGEGDVFRRFPTMGHDDVRLQAADLPSQAAHDPWIEPDAPEDALRHVELDVRLQQHRLGAEQRQYLVDVVVIAERVHQRAGISLRSPGKVVGEDVEDQWHASMPTSLNPEPSSPTNSHSYPSE